MIKQQIEDTIRKLEAERNQQANVVRDRTLREKIIPFNSDVDKARDEVIAKKQEELNKIILHAQESFAKEKQEIYEAAEKKKNDNSNAVISTEISIMTTEYEKAINELKKLLATVKE